MYIVIEKFDPEYPMIVTKYGEDMPWLFETMEEAQVEADECQDGQVVKIS